MKTRITRHLLMLPILLLGWATIGTAQQEENTEVIIVQTITEDDGTQSIIKKRVYAGDDAQTYIEENQEKLSAMWEGNTEEGAEHFMIIRRDDNGKRTKEVIIRNAEGEILEERHEGPRRQEEVYEFRWNEHKRGDNSAFMGVYPESNPFGEGVLLDGIVAETGAQRAGLRTGDVLVAIDDNELISHSDLGRVLNQYEPGQWVSVDFVRDGQPMSTQLELTGRNNYDRLERDPCQVFIGVGLGRQRAENGRGIHVSRVIPNTSAEEFGVAAGDVILRLDDVAVNTYDELMVERNRHAPGDWYTLTLLRYGNEMDLDLQFKACDEPEEEPITEEVTEEVPAVEPLEQIDGTLDLVEFSAFPNPTYGNLQVVFRADAVPTMVRITDMSGKTVYQENLQTFDGLYSKEINLRDVAPGALILTVQQEGRVQSEKVILLPRA